MFGSNKAIKEISVSQLKEKIDSGADFFLLDVREPNEIEIATIGGTLIPLDQVEDRVGELPEDKEIIVYCRSGGRSGQATRKLTQILERDDIYNLKGGILAWSDQIDSSVVKY